VRHFWQRWKNEYIVALQRYSKWKRPNDNFQVGDIVVIKEDDLVSSNWSIARVVKTNPGADGRVRVVTLKTKMEPTNDQLPKLLFCCHLRNNSNLNICYKLYSLFICVLQDIMSWLAVCLCILLFSGNGRHI